MNAKVMELVKELGFDITRTSPAYGVEDAHITAVKDGRTIRTSVTRTSLAVEITTRLSGSTEAANFYFRTGCAPDLRFMEYAPELLELARRFGAVAGFEI